jgi:hypothetical protein
MYPENTVGIGPWKTSTQIIGLHICWALGVLASFEKRRAPSVSSIMKRMKRRHHTVPRWYLKRFADTQYRLWRTPLKEPGSSDLISVKKATVVKDFYLVEGEMTEAADWIEDKLSEIEELNAEGFRAILDDEEWPISLETRMKIALWAAVQYLRVPAMRNLVNASGDEMFKLEVATQGKEGIERFLRSHLGREPLPSEVSKSWDEMTDFASYKVVPSNNEHLFLMFDMASGLTRTFLARSWTVIHFERKTLLTGDNPVCLLEAADHPKWMGLGPLNAGHILVALDRHTGLLMGEIPADIQKVGYGSQDLSKSGTANLAKLFNACIIANAIDTIYGHPDDRGLITDLLRALEIRNLQEST